MKKQKGFTLIELLVVIAILGILSTLAVVSLQNARVKARDARRVSDVKQIQTALELYYNENTIYPTPPTGGIIGGANALILTTGGATHGWEDATESDDTALIAKVPADPALGDCGAVGTYTGYIYTQATTGTYEISYCLSATTGGIAADGHFATPAGIDDGAALTS